MTITPEQSKELFGETTTWELIFVARPSNPRDALAACLEDPKVCEAADSMLRTLRLERETRSERPTRCLLCATHFLRQAPAVLVVMAPAARNGPGSGFALCDGCAAQPDLKGRVHAYLHAKFGAQWVQWGTG
jgi:hypothetical protein